MKLIFLACILVVCTAAKISPFVPRDIARHDVDVAKINFMKEKKIQAEAMEASKNIPEEMSEATEEPPVKDEKDDVVPIVVGSVLAGLIVVVLVSYFIVRARRAKE
eukprot:GFUD01039336.1.p1 GENE.GFUD01039336.1~~GFUD01039336.1.p1  ORF type:complete len:106 (+),score=38.71 GFUD01039336.1:119-436(+)